MEIIEYNNTELCVNCATGDIEDVEEILNTRVINKNFVDSFGNNPLTKAVMMGHLNIVKRLLEHPDIDVNVPCMKGWTPLMYAILSMDHPTNGAFVCIVRRLLEVPALQLLRCCHNGETALHYACKHNRVSILKLLCQDSRCTPALVNKKDSDGYTALMRGVCMGHLDIVKELDMEGTD